MVATAVFLRTYEGPDPYIYSQWDQSTWHLADYQRTYDNPCIAVYDLDGNFVPSNQLIVDTPYIVKVVVYNDRVGVVDAALDTTVKLRFANFGAGLLWEDIGEGTVTIPAGWVNVAEIPWTPTVVGHTCIRAEVSHPQDINLNNNVGQENAEVITIFSPGVVTFSVGNSNNSTEAQVLYLKVRQEGNYDDVWEAEIIDFSSYALEYGESVSVTLRVDSRTWYLGSQTRVFTVEVYIKGDLIGGISVSVRKLGILPPWWPFLLVGLSAMVIFLVLVHKRMAK